MEAAEAEAEEAEEEAEAEAAAPDTEDDGIDELERDWHAAGQRVVGAENRLRLAQAAYDALRKAESRAKSKWLLRKKSAGHSLTR